MFSKSANPLDLPQKTQSVCSVDPMAYSPPLDVTKPIEAIRLRKTISEALFFCPLYSPL